MRFTPRACLFNLLTPLILEILKVHRTGINYLKPLVWITSWPLRPDFHGFELKAGRCSTSPSLWLFSVWVCFQLEKRRINTPMLNVSVKAVHVWFCSNRPISPPHLWPDCVAAIVLSFFFVIRVRVNVNVVGLFSLLCLLTGRSKYSSIWVWNNRKPVYSTFFLPFR